MSASTNSPFVSTTTVAKKPASYSVASKDASIDDVIPDPDDIDPWSDSNKNAGKGKRKVVVESDDDDDDDDDASVKRVRKSAAKARERNHKAPLTHPDDSDSEDDDDFDGHSSETSGSTSDSDSDSDDGLSDHERVALAKKQKQKKSPRSADWEAAEARKMANKLGLDFLAEEEVDMAGAESDASLDDESDDVEGSDDDEGEDEDDDEDGPVEGVVRSRKDRIEAAVEGLIEQSQASISQVVEKQMTGRKFKSVKERVVTREKMMIDALEQRFGQEEGGMEGEDPVEEPTHTLVKTLLSVVSGPYASLPEHLSELCRAVMSSVLNVYVHGQPLSTDQSGIMGKIWGSEQSTSQFYHECKALFECMKHRTRTRMCAPFVDLVCRLFDSSAAYELMPVKATVNLASWPSDQPFHCIACAETVPTHAGGGGSMARYVSGVNVAQYKSSTLKGGSIKVISPHATSPQGSLGKMGFFMCAKCLPMVAIFNHVLLVPRIAQLLAMLWLRKNFEPSMKPDTIFNAFQQWELRQQWVSATVLCFKLLHSVLLD